MDEDKDDDDFTWRIGDVMNEFIGDVFRLQILTL